jgi:cellulose synthase/poly-beta-1,6-N-acetylglucosamine synthase-like glycosyltransferase
VDLAHLVLGAGVLFLLFTYLVWPAAVLLRARLLARPPRQTPAAPLPRVTCVVAAHDEGEPLVAKVRNLLALDYPPDLLEIVVADDGSTDGAPLRARAADPERVRTVRAPVRAGKPGAILRAVDVARGEVLLLCDVRQRFDRAAARELVLPLGDPAVGAVTGRLVLDGARGPGAYWRYETAIRAAEGRTGSVTGATGAIYAIRRELFPRDLPAETILDDVYVPMTLVLGGWRVAYAERALAFDRELDLGREFVRKVRTLAGNWQLLALLPELRNPLRSGVHWRFFWHKVARLLCPAALAAALLGALLAPGMVADVAIGLQIGLYGLAALGWAQRGRAGRLAALCQTFVALNAAAVAGLAVFLRGRAGVAWVRTGTVSAG